MTPTHDIVGTDDIERLVVDFYRDAAIDQLLGPVFASAHVDWPGHIATLVDFWSWQLLGVRGYEGNPLRAHVPVHARTPFTPAHFERWLELFTETVDGLFVGPVATMAKERGAKMAAAMQRILEGRWEHGPAVVQPLWAVTP